jgi:multisubunit Na+/H+ antiporter MnhB subunit
MNMAFAFDCGLALVVTGVAGWIVLTRATFGAVAGFVGFGLLLTLAWVRLSAIDVAMTEAAIGSLAGALMLNATARLRLREPATAAGPGPASRGVAVLLSVSIAAALAVAVLSLPDPAPTLAPAAAEHAAATGLGNPVTNVLMAFRAMDTLLEKVVLLLALVGLWSLAPDRVWGGRPSLLRRLEPGGTLDFLARLLPPAGIVAGIYVLWEGADHPGGAFQGGTILAAMWLLAMMAGITEPAPVSSRRLRLALIAGPAIFLAVGLAGLAFGSAFLAYPESFAKPLILLIEFAMTLTIAVTLALLLAGPPAREDSP